MARRRLYILACTAVLSGAPVGLTAQQPQVVDEGFFTITDGSLVVGKEEFALRRGRAGSEDGFTLTATASYPPTQATRIVTVRIEFGADSQPIAAEIQERSNVRRAVVMRFQPRRVTVRRVTAGGESAQEFPRRLPPLVYHDASFAGFALLTALRGDNIAVFSATDDSPLTVGLTDHGIERVRVKGVERPLRRLVLASDRVSRQLWFDEQGRLIQITIPGRDLKAVRDNS